jgi:uncharacterized small protein (DUF1192 family)
MAVFDDDPRRKAAPHEIGQDLSALSIEELTERIALLRGEIERLESAKARKSASMNAADAFFRSKQ